VRTRAESDPLADEWRRILQPIWESVYGGATVLVDEALFMATYKELMAAVELHIPIPADFNRPDAAFYKAMRENVYRFSAGKTWQQVGDIQRLMLDPSGVGLRPRKEFLQAVEQLGIVYNEVWLGTEYELAVASARQSADWQRAQAQKDILPYLQYQTVGDGLVRPDHAEYDGITLPVDDPFWNVFYPPNGYNCRCSVRQLRASQAEESEADQISAVTPPPAVFAFNPGKQQVMVAPDHPYFADANKAINAGLLPPWPQEQA
jgi:SPP1 gp7 family putative phage head morphogenesis protein